jgi:hypothetical protein
VPFGQFANPIVFIQQKISIVLMLDGKLFEYRDTNQIKARSSGLDDLFYRKYWAEVLLEEYLHLSEHKVQTFFFFLKLSTKASFS